jgi:uncharacterized protein YbbC (DUF1343 family)
MFSSFKKLLLALYLISLLASCSSSLNKKNREYSNWAHDTIATAVYTSEELLKSETHFTLSSKTGADNYNAYLSILKDKKVGVVTNQTGIVTTITYNKTDFGYKKTPTHLIDFLLEKNIQVQAIFAPEHGFRGTADAGELIIDGRDSKTGLPIISLYGDNKKPKPAQLT